MAEFKNLPHMEYKYEKPNEYIDPMKPLIEEFMTGWRLQHEDNILRAVADVGISVDKKRLERAYAIGKIYGGVLR